MLKSPMHRGKDVEGFTYVSENHGQQTPAPSSWSNAANDFRARNKVVAPRNNIPVGISATSALTSVGLIIYLLVFPCGSFKLCYLASNFANGFRSQNNATNLAWDGPV